MKGMLWRGFGGREDELAGMFSYFLLNSFAKMTYFVCMWLAAIGRWLGNYFISRTGRCYLNVPEQ